MGRAAAPPPGRHPADHGARDDRAPRRTLPVKDGNDAKLAYTGRTRSGEVVSGERASDSMENAVAALRVSSWSSRASCGQGEGRLGGEGGPQQEEVKAKNLAIFTRQFSVMIDAGLPLVQCLEILGSQERPELRRRHPADPRRRRGGAALADAMKKHPGTFDALYTNMVAAGEAGGILDAILKRLAVYIEKNVSSFRR